MEDNISTTTHFFIQIRFNFWIIEYTCICFSKIITSSFNV